MKLFITTVIFLFHLFTSLSIGQGFNYKEKREFPLSADYVRMAEYSPYMRYFAYTIGKNRLKLFNEDAQLIFEYQGNPESEAGVIAFSPDEQYLAYGRYKGKGDIAIIRLSDLKIIQVINAHSSYITSLTYSNNGRFLVSTGADDQMQIHIWDGTVCIPTQTIALSDQVNDACFNGSDQKLVSADNDGIVTVFKLKNDCFVKEQQIQRRGYIRSVRFHPQKDELYFGSSNYLLKYSFERNGYVATDSLKTNVNNNLSISPNGKYIVFGAYNELKIVNLQGSLRYEESIYRHTEHVFGGSFSPNGLFLASYSSDKKLIVWQIDGVAPSTKSLVDHYLLQELTLAQRKMLTPAMAMELLSGIDRDLTKERDEFETSKTFLERRQVLSDLVLSKLQQKMELYYDAKVDNAHIKLAVQALIGYNADVEIYKLKVLETEGGAKIPVEAAKQLKQHIDKAYVEVDKKLVADGSGYQYSNFRLVHPVSGKKYALNLLENPFGKEKKLDLKDQLVADGSADKSLGAEDDSYNGYALLFATNMYNAYSELANPVFDATVIAEELRVNYSMQVEMVVNPTLNETIEKLREYAKKDFRESDHLFIFFAGHGTYDDVFKEGYIISRDSEYGDEAKTSYLSHSNLRTIVNNIPCNHVLLVMDVCFGGTFDPLIAVRSRAANMYSDISTEEFVERKIKYKTRLYLTSGGKEYVPDGRPGHHSPFTRRLLEAFREYGGADRVLTSAEIIQFMERVTPQPQFGEFGNNEPGSDFLLISK